MALTAKQQEFLRNMGTAARADMSATGILASLTTAQGILESAWGQSGLAVNHNNYFGIKKGSGWNGAVALMPTKEWNGTQYIDVMAEFRKYNTMLASVADHSALFLRLDRYKPLRGERDYKKACQAVQAAGYATSPTYASSLIQLIETYNLAQFDTAATSATQPPSAPPAANAPSAATNTPAASTGGIKAGSVVTIDAGAVYGGANERTRGLAVPYTQFSPKRHTVKQTAERNGGTEALLAEINSWVSTKYLTKIQ